MAESKALIYEAIPKIMEEMSAIGKNKKNQQQGFLYRGIDDLYNELHPVLAKYKVFTVPMVLEDRTEERQTKSGGVLIYRILKMKYTFYASDGSFFEAVVMGEGMDSGDKACNKAMSIAHKYAFFQVFAVATEDLIDPDAITPPESTKKGGSNEKGKGPTELSGVPAAVPTAGTKGTVTPTGGDAKQAPKEAEKKTGAGNIQPDKGSAGNSGPNDGGVFPAYSEESIEEMFKAAVAVANHPADYKLNPKHIPLIMQPAIAIKGSGDVAAMKYYMADLKAYLEEAEDIREEMITHLGVE